MAEHTGRGRTRQAKDAGPVKKRKARNVLVTARQTTKGNAAQASDRSELTVKAVMSSLKQQVLTASNCPCLSSCLRKVV